ncbi:ParB-like nuclease domain-containing protein [Blastococcus mobilis]|uniref:ParB-like nuclease domain-containing protein n=2 Tax=Blastococcus mobilis TaxID=1938746 RepID=A0A238ZRR8_9ACTN|nr:ParB-like nuclease domain-containing protein [Blastococcus mobilis]
MVPLDMLRTAARLRPADPAHVERLATALDDTPPVLVRRDDDGCWVLVDGFMRVDAARALGRSTVRVQWVDGDEAEAWERAIRANASHGLPLTAKQRREAALRLLALAPEWSDRRISSACGVDARSVARWRKSPGRSGEEMPHASSGERIGRDGRRYLSAEDLEARRQAVRELLRRDPGLSDRELGRRAGLSASAVRRVRVQSLPTAPAVRAVGRRRAAWAVAAGMLRSAGRAVRRAAVLLGRLLRT